ncbi:hypothetical protein JCM11641_002777 [Rhodosporidiobolus odoratus]
MKQPKRGFPLNMLQSTLAQLLRFDGPSGSWVETVKTHVERAYPDWMGPHQFVAQQILLDVLERARGGQYGRGLPRLDLMLQDLGRDPYDPDPDNVSEMLHRISHNDHGWFKEIDDWIRTKWNSKGRRGNEAIVEALLNTEVSKYYDPEKFFEKHPPDTVISKLAESWSDVPLPTHKSQDHLVPYPSPAQSVEDSLLIKLIHLVKPLFCVQTLAPHIYDESRTAGHPYHSIGHRAAKHYGTTKSRWEAGHRW